MWGYILLETKLNLPMFFFFGGGGIQRFVLTYFQKSREKYCTHRKHHYMKYTSIWRPVLHNIFVSGVNMQYYVSLAPVKYKVLNKFLFLKGNTSNSGDDGSVKIKWLILYCTSINWHFKFGWISTEREIFPSCTQSLIDGNIIQQRKTIILEDYRITIWKWRSGGTSEQCQERVCRKIICVHLWVSVSVLWFSHLPMSF